MFLSLHMNWQPATYDMLMFLTVLICFDFFIHIIHVCCDEAELPVVKLTVFIYSCKAVFKSSYEYIGESTLERFKFDKLEEEQQHENCFYHHMVFLFSVGNVFPRLSPCWKTAFLHWLQTMMFVQFTDNWPKNNLNFDLKG